MLTSFRTRLFAMATLIVAVVLGVVLVLGWYGLVRIEIDRLEDRLCMEARRVATQPWLGRNAASLEVDMKLRLRLGETTYPLLLRLETGPDTPPLLIGDWTLLPDAATLPWRMGPRSGPPPGRRPPGDGYPGELGAADDLRPPPPDGGGFRPPPPQQGGRPPPPRGQCELSTSTLQGRQARVARFTTPRSRAVLALPVAAVTDEMQGDLNKSLRIVVPLALALTGLGAWLLSGLTMRPVNRLRAAMQGLTPQALDRRVATAGEDREFRDLIDAYNTMLARLQASFQQASRFSADAAHELKTPLTILQGRLEQAIQQSGQSGKGGGMQADLSEMLEEVGRLNAITRKLLLLAQADAGQLALHRETVDLADLLDTLVGDARMLVSQQRVDSTVEPGLATRGDALLLRQLCNNLLSNALRYTTVDGWITVSGRRSAAGVEVVFANATQPLDAAARSRFFDRFHRGDAAHNRDVDGHGLGLSLSREIARAHGGDLVLLDGPADEVRLRLTLPGVA